MNPPFKNDQPSLSTARRKRNKIPFYIFGAFAFFILSKEVPWIHDSIQRIINPQAQAAVEICRDAALRDTDHPEFIRLIKRGRATETQSGYVVKKLIVGDLVPEDGETRFLVTCHVDQHGVLANIHRDPLPTILEEKDSGDQLGENIHNQGDN